MATASPVIMSEEQFDVIDFVVNKGNGAKALSDMNLKTVPHHYILPTHERFEETKTKSGDWSVPIIDVLNWEDDPRTSESIRDAARKWGFFQIINHGIPMEVLENVLDAGHRFFGLPAEERKKYYFPAGNSGSTAQLKTSHIPQKEKALAWVDYLTHIYCSKNGNTDTNAEAEEGEEKDHPKGFSNWPHVSRNQVLEYMKWTKPVIKKLLEVLMKGLNVEKIDESRENELMGTLIVNLMYYPKCPNPDLTAGLCPHADVSTISILLQDDTGGLYVRGKEKNAWIHVEPVKGALVINIGDVLQIMGNDRYHSIEHRVSTNVSKNRVSVPIFVNPSPDAVIGTLEEALEIREKPIYKKVLYSDYFKYFFSKPHDGKQTIEYAKI